MASWGITWGLFLLGQVWDHKPGTPALVSFPNWGSKRAIVWIAIAWPHAPAQQAIGEVVARMASQELPFGETSQRLRAWADSLGLSLSVWSGPEGAALLAAVPRPALTEVVRWMYTALAHLPVGDPRAWHLYRRAYLRPWSGFSLKRELLWRLLGSSKAPGSFTPEDLALYTQRYLRPESLRVLVGGGLALREKSALQKIPFRASFAAPADPPPTFPPLSSTPDTTEENLWAYPAYAGLLIQTPRPIAERLAFLQAFLTLWQKEAPPLSYEGTFYGPEHYILQARLDGASYRFLRNLSHLQPRDSIEYAAWQAAYALGRAAFLSHPGLYPDLWVASVLRQDTFLLPDTLPAEIWQKGWPFSRQGIWLYNEWVLQDTLPRENSDTLRTADTARATRPPDLLWKGQGSVPLAEWASAIQLFWQPEAPPCELIGYYPHKKAREKRLKELHHLRKLLIQRYGIAPAALRVVLHVSPPDFPPQAIRLRCSAP